MNRKLFLSVPPVLCLGLWLAAATPGEPAEPAPAESRAALVARGKYLVDAGGCTDCHTPWQMGEKGFEPDFERWLSGHPQDLVMPPAPELPPGPWAITVAETNTAWAGPWGVSFTANLTPDPETGLGTWTEDVFIATIRNGRHLGLGRELLPPMPWINYRLLTDEDLKAIFAHLQSLPPVRNRVPEPIAPRN